MGRGKVRPQDDKVAAIRDWPRPTTKKQVKSFLGLVGYYQRFIPGFATMAHPLNELTRKALPDRVRWTETAETAFGALRRALCCEPVLITPDFSLPLIVHTDTSEVGLGGSSRRSGKERNTPSPTSAASYCPTNGTTRPLKKKHSRSSGHLIGSGITF